MNAFKHPLLSVSHISLLLHNLNKETERRAGMSVVQWCILKNLIEMPATSPQELSEVVRVHPSSLTQSLKRLIRKEFIFVTEDPRDSRKKIVSITRKGKQALDHSEQEMDQIGNNLEPICSKLRFVEEHLFGLRKKYD